MSSNISFHEETGKLKIELTISLLSSIGAIFIRIVFLAVSLYLFCMGLVLFVLSIGGAIGVLPNYVLSDDEPGHLIFYFIIGTFLLCVNTIVIIILIGSIRYRLLRRTRESLEINDRIIRFSWSEIEGYYRIRDRQLYEETKYITKVLPNTETLKGSVNGASYTYDAQSCLIIIYGRGHKFGRGSGLSSEDTQLLARKINLFLGQIKQIP